MDDRDGGRERVREIRASSSTWWWWWWWYINVCACVCMCVCVCDNNDKLIIHLRIDLSDGFHDHQLLSLSFDRQDIINRRKTFFLKICQNWFSKGKEYCLSLDIFRKCLKPNFLLILKYSVWKINFGEKHFDFHRTFLHKFHWIYISKDSIYILYTKKNLLLYSFLLFFLFFVSRPFLGPAKYQFNHHFKFLFIYFLPLTFGQYNIALIPLGKVWIQLFSLQLWVNSKTD